MTTSSEIAQHDMVVIGGGPGGYATALYAAAAGLDVGLVEKGKLGGTCLHVGCIPAKELLEVASVYKTVASANEFGVSTSEPALDMSVVQQRKQGVIDKLTKGVAHLLKNRKVTVYDGQGQLLSESDGPDSDSRYVNVTGADGSAQLLAAATVVLATGSVPKSLPLPGFEYDSRLVLNSDHLLSIEEVPSSAVIIGAGAVGCEFASLLSDLGTEITLLEALPNVLPGADEEVSKTVKRSFKKRGMDIRCGVSVTSCEKMTKTVRVALDDDAVVADCVVVSVGRRPVAETFGGEQAGVELNQRGFVGVDEFCRTSRQGVYAVGDLIETPQLAHIAFAEAMVVVSDVLGEAPQPLDYSSIPWGIYSHPEVAFAGLTEQAAKEAGYEVVTAVLRFAGNSRAMIIGETEGFVKVVAEKKPDGTAGTVLGVHIVGPWATELLGQAYLTVNWEAEVADLAGLIQPHPTLSELYGEAMQSLAGRPLHG